MSLVVSKITKDKIILSSAAMPPVYFYNAKEKKCEECNLNEQAERQVQPSLSDCKQIVVVVVIVRIRVFDQSQVMQTTMFVAARLKSNFARCMFMG